jgi:hypothetical protein
MKKVRSEQTKLFNYLAAFRNFIFPSSGQKLLIFRASQKMFVKTNQQFSLNTSVSEIDFLSSNPQNC